MVQSNLEYVSKMFSKKIIYFPRIFFIGYLLVTIFMFTVSPWKWPLASPIKFCLFNIVVLIMFYLGYNNGLKQVFRKRKGVLNISLLHKLIKISLITNLFFIYPKFLFRLNLESASPSLILEKLLKGLFLPAEAYIEKHELTYEGFLTFSNPLVLLYNLFIPLLYLSIPLCIFYWKNLKRYQKVLFFIILISDILSYIAIGTNKGIFDIILITPWLILAVNPNGFLSNKIDLNKYRKIIFFLSIFFLGISYFVEGNLGRKNDNFYYEQSTGVKADQNASMFIPDGLYDSYLALDSYLTQGYYALGLALDSDYKPTFGFGHSFFLTSIGEKIFGKESISDRTYQHQLDKNHGWSQYGKWHSFYVSMANDLTFYGVFLLVFLIGHFFSKIWIDVICRNSIVAVPLFCLFIIMLFYFPANNQVLGFQGSSIVFWTLFIFWINERPNLYKLRVT